MSAHSASQAPLSSLCMKDSSLPMPELRPFPTTEVICCLTAAAVHQVFLFGQASTMSLRPYGRSAGSILANCASRYLFHARSGTLSETVPSARAEYRSGSAECRG